MKVLIVYPEVNPNDNPFTRTLVKGLRDLGCDVNWGRKEFWNNWAHYDIINFHWPDAMFDKMPPSDSDFELLEKHIQVIKRTCKIIYTRHNEMPHYTTDANRHKCYKLIEKNADAIIHLGRNEIELYKERLNNSSVKHFFIPHHIYENMYNNTITIKEARQKLNIPLDKFVVLTFGEYRDMEEADMVLSEFAKAKIQNKLLFAPRLMKLLIKHTPKNVFLKWLESKTRTMRLKSQKIKTGIEFVSDDVLENYFSAADVVLIQRKHILNSGNVPLAFYFKKPVIGPNVGNIGELLKHTGNALFDPYKKGSLCKAFHEAEKLAATNLGQNNYDYAVKNMSIAVVAQQYLDVYKTV
ncbi:MAG TPA: glycosyltransferase family 4 protein [Bacteroidia bacterium]|nr:glycosyltransferase family 4 protein [Bacteroidia bacterium]